LPKYNENHLFAALRLADRDSNGFLEWNEYQNCLLEIAELSLTPEETLTLNLLADVDGDGKIDYQEFMKHF
jgi:Ca2+-binding EF-hand superfamily protein